MNDLPPPDITNAALKEAEGLLNKFLGPVFSEAGAMLGNRARIFRLRQEISLLRKAGQILSDKGLKPKAVNIKVLFPLLDAAVLEENDEMADRWASLLASSADPQNESTLHASFVEILKQLAPDHAFVLDVFYDQIKRDQLPCEEWFERGYVLSYLKDFLVKDVPQFDVALENLFRLKLVAHPTVRLGVANGEEVRFTVTSSNILCATNLGYEFISACGHGRTPRAISYSVSRNSVSNVFHTEGRSLNLWSKLQEQFWAEAEKRAKGS